MAESNFVNFKVGTSAAYAALAEKDANTLYFLSDSKQIMKGRDNYTSSVIFVNELPVSGIENKLYIAGNKASVYTNSAWRTIYDLDTKASLSGATFTGTVVLASDPTADLEAATKKYVDLAIDNKVAANDAMRYKGTLGTGGTITTIPSSNVRQGDTYKIITAGQYAGVNCEVGDMIIALENKAVGSTDANWTIIQGNIDGAITGPVSAVNSNIAVFDGATGKVIKDSGKKYGGATFEATASSNTLATEVAAKSYADGVKTEAKSYTDTKMNEAKTYADSTKPVWVEI